MEIKCIIALLVYIRDLPLVQESRPDLCHLGYRVDPAALTGLGVPLGLQVPNEFKQCSLEIEKTSSAHTDRFVLSCLFKDNITLCMFLRCNVFHIRTSLSNVDIASFPNSIFQLYQIVTDGAE